MSMLRQFGTLLVALCIVAATAGSAGAQTPPAGGGKQGAGWKIGAYPIYVWVPFGIGIDVSVPPSDNGGDGGSAQVADSGLDGAYLGGIYVARGRWRIEADGLWLAIWGSRVDSPFLTVDADVAYFHAGGGVRVYKDFYATAGVRRYALTYDIQLASRPAFQRTLGIWDPVIGAGWHYERDKFEVHATFDGGGFGVGADVDLGASARVDWKPVRHFGITGGYSALYLKASNTLAGRSFTVKQTLHGPILGIGFYF